MGRDKENSPGKPQLDRVRHYLVASYIFGRSIGLVRTTLSGSRKIAEPYQRYQAQHPNNRNTDDRCQQPSGSARRPHDRRFIRNVHEQKMSPMNVRSDD
jgi:hypothetical protein